MQQPPQGQDPVRSPLFRFQTSGKPMLKKKKKRDTSKYIPINIVKCHEGKIQGLRPQKLHLTEMGKVWENLSQEMTCKLKATGQSSI